MPIRKAFFKLLILPLLGLSCAKGSDESSLSAATVPKRGVLLVVMGGFTECPDGNLESSRYILTGKLQKIEEAIIESGREVKKLQACFGADLRNLDKVSLHFSLPGSPQQGKSVWGFMDAASAEINANPDYDVHIIGYSHGGWLALKLMEERLFNQPIQTLFTVDPISRLGCSPLNFLKSTFMSLQGTDQSCLEFPADFSETSFASDKAKTWKNYYQVNSSFIHSEAAPFAENIFRDYSWKNGLHNVIVDGHLMIWEDRSIWDDFKQSVLTH